MKPKKILDSIIEKCKGILNENLVGVYLHGSLAMGCYTNESDIDFIIVVKEPMDISTKKRIIQSIIHLNDLPQKGVEMSIVLEKYTKDFLYPTPFELHYSNFHREKYLSDNNYICGNSTDKDLAAHFTVIRQRGACLYGKKIEEVFGDVSKAYYMDAIINDVENGEEDIIENTVYIILNLCRVFYYVKKDVICSKLEAGNWAKEIVVKEYRKIVEEAVRVYIGELSHMDYDEDILKEYAGYMLMEIKHWDKIRY